MREGTIVNLANHTLLLARDGSERPIADSGAPICNEQGQITGVVLVFRDQTNERRAEESLRESELRYRALFESSSDAVLIMAPPSWNFTSCNPAAVRMFNVKDEAELASLGPWKLFPEKQPDGRPSAETAKEIIEAVVREGSRVFEWTHKRLGGEDFPSTVSLTRMELAGQTVLQVRVRDISEWTSTRDREALAPTIGGRQSASGGFALPRIAGGQVQKNHRGGGETHGSRLLPHLDRATLRPLRGRMHSCRRDRGALRMS